MDNLNAMVGVRRVHKMKNEHFRELYSVKTAVNEIILRWFGLMERTGGI